MSLAAYAIIKPDYNQVTLQNITGGVAFYQAVRGGDIVINLSLAGIPPNVTHGWHIHQNAVTESPHDCLTTGTHFNPLNVTHGAPSNNASFRHVGDLGNFVTDANGMVNLTVTDHIISLFAPFSVGNLAVVIHSKADDLGLGNNTDSLNTGNSGTRQACGNIKIIYPDGTSTGAVPTTTPTGKPNSGKAMSIGWVSLMTLLVL